MNILDILVKLRDDLKTWVTNNILALKEEIDKSKFSGEYEDLFGKPDIDNKIEIAIEPLENELENKANKDELFSGDYSDLENKPDIDGKIDSAIAGLVDSAPDSLNTLNELAQALGDNANFSTTVIEQIGLKANKDELFSGDYNDLKNKPVIDEITDEEIDAIIASLDE